MTTTHYSEDDIIKRLTFYENWKYSNGYITRLFKFSSFIEAFTFMTSVAIISEKINHHPDWFNSYNVVEIKLKTHNSGGITEKDFILLEAIDKQLSKLYPV